MISIRSAGFLMLAALLIAPAHAVFKCTDPKTKQTSYSDAPCPKAMSDVKMEWQPNANTNTVGAAVVGTTREPDRDLKMHAQGGALLDIYRRWIDAERLASATARVALATPVATLQELARTVTATPVPQCLAPAKASLAKLVRTSADVHIQFMLKDDFTPIIYKRVDRDKMIGDFEYEAKAAIC